MDLIGIASVILSYPSSLLATRTERLFERTPKLASFWRQLGELPENEHIERHAYRAHLGTLENLLVRAKFKLGKYQAEKASLEEIIQQISSDIRQLDRSNWREGLDDSFLVHDRESIEAALQSLELVDEQSELLVLLARRALEEVRGRSLNVDARLFPEGALRNILFDSERGYAATFLFFLGDEIKFGSEEFFRILSIKELTAIRTDTQKLRREIIDTATSLQARLGDRLVEEIAESRSSFGLLSQQVSAMHKDLQVTARRMGATQPTLGIGGALQPNPTELSQYYVARSIPLVGRNTEFERLLTFSNRSDKFLWIQISGEGGQGKSRIALELALTLWGQGWLAGFIEPGMMKAFSTRWLDWEPTAPTLIVIDYVTTRLEATREMLSVLAQRDLPHPVRVVIIERQSWNRFDTEKIVGPRSGESSGTGVASGYPTMGVASWYSELTTFSNVISESRFEDGLVHLESLSTDKLIGISNQWLKLHGGNPELFSDDEIASLLARIDSGGRPLYAYFLGEVLSGGDRHSSLLTKGDLLSRILQRERATRWRVHYDTHRHVPSLGSNEPAIHLAWLATAINGLDLNQWSQVSHSEYPPDALIVEANLLTDGELSESGARPYVAGIRPDILGGWFLLAATEGGGFPWAELLNLAWRLKPRELAACLVRLAQDHPDHGGVFHLLSVTPPTYEASEAYSAKCQEILNYLVLADAKVPLQVFLQLRSLVESHQDPGAMFNLGLCNERGYGVQINQCEAFKWYKRSKDTGFASASNNLAICYESGIGTEVDQDEALMLYEAAATSGDINAIFNLGQCYRRGVGTQVDLSKAFECYSEAASMGLPAGMFNLAAAYFEGIGTNRNEDQAFFWYSEAANSGISVAMRQLGICYESGTGTDPNFAKAVEWYRKAADLADPEAMFNLAQCLSAGVGAAPDAQGAFQWYLKAAQSQLTIAMNSVAECYEGGLGTEQNLIEAYRWYLQAAKEGDAGGMFNVSQCLIHGIGVVKNSKEGFGWLSKSAESGVPVAMRVLAHCFRSAIGTPVSNTKALVWETHAARAGDTIAMFNLGVYYFRNTNKGDRKKAVSWFRKAAESGHALAMFNLARSYEMGNGVKRNKTRALRWYERAAKLGEPRSMYNLAMFYSLGDGVAKDERVAFEWFLEAAKCGLVEAMRKVSLCWETGIGTKVDEKNADYWLHLASTSESGLTRQSVPNADEFAFDYLARWTHRE